MRWPPRHELETPGVVRLRLVCSSLAMRAEGTSLSEDQSRWVCVVAAVTLALSATACAASGSASPDRRIPLRADVAQIGSVRLVDEPLWLSYMFDIATTFPTELTVSDVELRTANGEGEVPVSEICIFEQNDASFLGFWIGEDLYWEHRSASTCGAEGMLAHDLQSSLGFFVVRIEPPFARSAPPLMVTHVTVEGHIDGSSFSAESDQDVLVDLSID